MKEKLLEILVCPSCKQAVEHDKKASELICKQCELAFPVHDDIPILLIDEARQLKAEKA